MSNRPKFARRLARHWLSPALGLALTVAALGGAAQCSTTDGDTSPVTIRFSYDEEGNRVRVHLGRSIDSDTRVVARVRYTTITDKLGESLDCDELAGSTSVDVVTHRPDGEPLGGGPDFGYLGPPVDTDMRVPFFQRVSVPPQPDNELLDLIRAGTDPIIEACVVKSGETLGKATASLFRVWDDNVPDRVARILAVERGGAADPLATYRSVVTYGQVCEAELGEIPFFPKLPDGNYKTYDCTTGEYSRTIPITVTDQNGRTQEVTALPPQCDRPDWLRGSCDPYVRINHARNAQGTDWILLCRKPDVGIGPTDTKFNDMAIIGHNPKTGRSCFFQNSLYAKTDAGHVPSPADPLKSETVWANFKPESCHRCHDNEPFVHSPWVDQVKEPGGGYTVPRIDNDPAYTRGGWKFSLLGMKSMNWQMHRVLTSPEASACTQCHRFSDGTTMVGEGDDNTSSWVARSVGLDTAFNANVTPAFLSFSNSHWMPPSLAGLDETTWDASDMGQAVRFIMDCSTSGQCQFTDMPQ